MIKHCLTGLAAFAVLASLSAQPIMAQESAAAATPSSTPVTVEGYYRIKWGSDREFFELYEKNHLPILKEAQARGIVTDIRIDFPFTHMAGGTRWDMRVSMTYRDASAALVTDPALGAVFDEVVARLKKDNPAFDAEEAKRFSLLEEHWDVVLAP